MKRRDESGFALLLVFLLAAAIAISLYMEMPRVAFESQRAREQLSIDRGMQYERAIQLFYRKYRLYPQTLDDLETTRNIRFLRQRYMDPLTGKEYRLLHVGPAGQLTDSLIKPANPLQGGQGQGQGQSASSNSASNTTSASAQAPTALGPDGQPIQPVDPLNMAARRPSDRITPPSAEQPVESDQSQEQPLQNPYPSLAAQQQPDQGQPGQLSNQVPNPAQPGQPVLPGQQFIPGQPQFPGQPGQPFPGQPGQPQDPSQANQFPNQPQYPGQQPVYPGQPPIPGQPFQPQDPSQIQQNAGQFPQYPGQSNFSGQPNIPPPGLQPTPPQFNPFQNQLQNQNPGQTYNPFQQSQGVMAGQQLPGAVGSAQQPTGGIAPQQNQAANLIQQILTTPRQPPPSVAGLSGGNMGGIAGVASNAEGKGIHKVNDHNKYKEWEFVYDVKNDKTALGGAVIPQQQLPQNVQQSPFGTSPVTPGNNLAPAAPSAPTTPPPTSQ